MGITPEQHLREAREYLDAVRKHLGEFERKTDLQQGTPSAHEQALRRILYLTEPGGDEFVEGICDIAEAALMGKPPPPPIDGENPE